MKIVLLAVGKTREAYLVAGIEDYVRRIGRYLPFEFVVAPDLRNVRGLSPHDVCAREAEMVLKVLREEDYVVLLDEGGREMRSAEFAEWLNKRAGGSARRLVFVIGGPYGFSERVVERADENLSLSRLTFSHQMVRLIFAEQLYRACTILHHEPYHHE